jgi:hypothetical protein
MVKATANPWAGQDGRSPIAGDLLRGVPQIAAAIGLPERPTRHLCETGALPVFRLGKLFCARRSELQQALSAQREG